MAWRWFYRRRRFLGYRLWFLPVNGVMLVATLLLMNFLWEAWNQLKPSKPEPDSKRASVLNDARASIMENLRESRDEHNLSRLAIAPFLNDPTDAVSNSLRQYVFEFGGFDLAPQTFMNRVRDFCGFSERGIGTDEQALKLARRMRADATLYGRVERFETIDSQAYLRVWYRLVERESRESICEGVYDSEERRAASSSLIDSTVDLIGGAFSAEVARGDGLSLGAQIRRFLAWLLIALCFPIVTISFLSTMVSKRSNVTNAFVLAVYTLIDGILAWFMVSPSLGSWGSIVLFSCVMLFAMLYNVKIMSLALQRAGD